MSESHDADRTFTVAISSSGKEYPVPPGSTIRKILQEEGFSLPSTCQMGSCGTCETGVLQGVPDHRDHILNEAERASNKSMMICCSRAKSDRLVLDL